MTSQMSMITFFLFLACTNLPLIESLVWRVGTGDALNVCEGGDAVFDWSFSLPFVPFEELYSIEWSFDPGDTSNTVLYVADFIHGRFLRNHEFPRSVTMVNNAGLILRNVSAGDKGTYSVVVNVIGDNKHVNAYNQSVRLSVAEASKLEGDRLQLTLSPVAVKGPDLGTWYAQLRCGRFEHLGQQPVAITWTKPDGTEVSSADNNNGDFLFNLTSQDMTGSYTCRVTSHQSACAQGQATYRVESAPLRLILIEARMSRLEKVLAPVAQMAKLKHDAEREFEKHLRLNDTLKGLWLETGKIMREILHRHTPVG